MTCNQAELDNDKCPTCVEPCLLRQSGMWVRFSSPCCGAEVVVKVHAVHSYTCKACKQTTTTIRISHAKHEPKDA